MHEPRNPDRTHVVHEESATHETTVGRVDLANLRTVFAALFDRTMAGVQRAGLDADDVVLEREVLVQVPGSVPRWQPVEFLADEVRFRNALVARVFAGSTSPLLDAQILAVRVVAVTSGGLS